MTYTSAEIGSVIGIQPLGIAVNDLKHLLLDSRKGIRAEGGIFFASKGARNDGHDYVMEMAYKGVRCFVVERWKDEFSSLTNQACFFVVENAIEALQLLAAWHRKRFNTEVIGITGSNGKTIVKEWLFQLLEPELTIVRSPKSYNSQIGVPLSVWRLHEQAELGIFEAGISKNGEMERIERVIRPTIGLLTHLGEAHADGFSSVREKITEKLRLFARSNRLIFCGDNELVLEEVLKIQGPGLNGPELICWTMTSDLSIGLGKLNLNETYYHRLKHYSVVVSIMGKGTHIRLFEPSLGEPLEFEIPFTDEASISNAIHCRVVLAELGFKEKFDGQRFRYLNQVVMRLEMMEAKNNCMLINDSYSMDWDSLKIALDFLKQQNQFERKAVVLSDIPGEYKDEKKLYQELTQLLIQYDIKTVIGIGPAFCKYNGMFANTTNNRTGFETFEAFESVSALVNSEKPLKLSNEAILVKGARSFGLEQVCKIWQQKAHETQLAINLNAVVDNLNYYRSKIEKSTKVMAMVKASSYGSGGLEIATVLGYHRVDYLSVAFIDEGVALRKAGVGLPIMVLNPEERGYADLLEYDLEPELFSLRTAKRFIEFIQTAQQQEALTNMPVKVHLKLDTGMHRLGFEEDDIFELLDLLKANAEVRVASVFSHLSSADDPNEDDFTKGQIKRFSRLSKVIQTELNYPILLHLLNSPGITRFAEAQFDMVRLGIGLYGIGCNEAEQEHLTFAHRLTTTISQIKHLEAGESIGYGRSFISDKAMHIATLPIGYADGFNRSLSNGKGGVVIHGKRVPVVGRVCMDMCMVDISEVHAQEGDEVIVFGEEYPITQFAEDAGTIAYEVLTSLSPRVKRVYYQE